MEKGSIHDVMLYKELWSVPNSRAIKSNLLGKTKINTTCMNSSSYLIYGESNGFNYPPEQFKKELSLESGRYEFKIQGNVSDNIKNINYLLIYNDQDQIEKYTFGLNECVVVTIKENSYFKIAIKIDGNGTLSIDDILFSSIDVIEQLDESSFSRAINFQPNEQIISLLPRNRHSNFEEISYDIINDHKFYFKEYGTIYYGEKIDWNNDFEKGRSYLRLLHGFVWLGDIVKQLLLSNDPYLAKASLDIIENWIDENPFDKKKMCWHDETTALRLINLTSYFFHVKKFHKDIELNKIYSCIEEHAKLLASDDFYAGNNNHGMFQSFSLLINAYSLPSNKEREDRKEKAKNRLIGYFNQIISKEGVHKEHTPVYHYLIVSNLKRYGQVFCKIDKHFGEYLLTIYEKTKSYSIHCLKPNGYFPQIGDNQNESPRDIGFKNLYSGDEYQYAITGGKSGSVSGLENSVVFEDSGYAVFRNSWNLGERATYILFTAAYHTDYHKHSDDLSFMLYSDGDIIIDSGPNGYDYKEPETQYAYSSYAHNTLLVDGCGLPRVDHKYGKTKIVDYSIESMCSEVTGVNMRFDGVSHQRQLKYFNEPNQLKIIDRIESDETHEYELLYHFALDIKPEIREKDVYLYRNSELVAIIEFDTKAEFELCLNFGEQDQSSVHGYYFDKFKHKNDTYVLGLKVKEKSTTIQTKIDIHT